MASELFPGKLKTLAKQREFLFGIVRALGYVDGSTPAEIGGLATLDIASQAQAEAGTDNATGMTPLRTAQAISALGAGGGNWTPVENSTNAETIEDADHEKLIRLTHTGGPITVTMAAGTTAQKTGGVHKATTQPVTLAMQAAQAAGAGASYILPDGTTGTTSLTLLGTFTWVCLTNSDADSAIYLLSGDFAIVDFRGAALHGHLATVETASGALADGDSGKYLTTSAAVTVPTTTGWHCQLELGGDHDITFNATTLDVSAQSWATGDVLGVLVKSATTIRVTRVAAADVVDQTDFA